MSSCARFLASGLPALVKFTEGKIGTLQACFYHRQKRIFNRQRRLRTAVQATMPSILNYLKRPEYIFRPQQVFQRFRHIGKRPQPVERVTLPWGATVSVHPTENVGSDIYHYGIFDRIVPETIYRLTDPGELTIEVGANIGQNCSIMAYKTGPQGRVIAFEPHPEIFEELKSNVALWPKTIAQTLQLEQIALGDTNAEAWLSDGPEFRHNRGGASLSPNIPASDSGRKHRVAVRRLDEYLAAPTKAGVCKIDVEGHELSVLHGAEPALSRHAIRDVIFEDFSQMPSPVADFLARHSYTLFRLTASWWKPRLTEVRPGDKPPAGFSYNYLATSDPQRAKARFQSGGWRCLMCPRLPQ